MCDANLQANFTNLPRLTQIFAGGSAVIAAKGPNVEIYEKRKGKFRLLRKLSNFHGTDDEVTNFTTSPNSVDVLFYSAGRCLVKFSLNGLLENLGDPCSFLLHKEGRRIVYLYVLNHDQLLLVLCSDGSISSYTVNDLSSPVHRRNAPFTIEIMGAVATGDSWNDLKVLMFTYLGSMLQIVPSRSTDAIAVYDGSPGMVFGAVISGSYCFTIHDDRSLRAWSLVEKGDVSSLTAEFAHKARPFAIAMSDSSTIFTSANDRTIVKWTWNESEHALTIVNRIAVAIGTIRHMLIVDYSLLISSDSGNLVSIPSSSFEPTPLLIHTHEEHPEISYRSCFSSPVHGDFFIDSQGQVIDKATNTIVVFPDGRRYRYFSENCGNTEPLPIAWSSESLVVLSSGTLSPFSAEDGSVIVSVLQLTGSERILVAHRNDILIVMDTSCEVKARFFLRAARLTINKRGPFVLSAAECLRTGSKTHYLIGCMTGHVLSVTFEDERDTLETKYEMNIEKALGKLFGGDSVQSLFCEDNHIYGLGKVGYAMTWAVDPYSDELRTIFVEKSSLSRCGSMDWPCRFVEDKQPIEDTRGRRFVVGFHSTSCMLVEWKTGWIVWRAECGGGNRHWQFELRKGVAKLTFIRDETVCVASGLISLPTILDSALHIGKTVFVESMPFNNKLYLFSAGNDNRLVVSEIDKQGNSRVILTRVAAEDFVSGILCKRDTTPGTASLVIGLSKGKMQVFDVDLTRVGGSGEILPSALLCTRTLNNPAGSTGRLQVAAEWVSSGVEGKEKLLLGVVDDASATSRLLLHFEAEKSAHDETDPVISSDDRAGFSKIICVRGVLIGASTNGYLYAANSLGKQATCVKLADCGLSAIAGVIGSPDSRILISVGDEAGTVHLVSLCAESMTFERLCSRNLHIATITGVRLANENSREFLIATVGADCEVCLSKFTVEDEKGEVLLISRRSCAVQDPSCIDLVQISEVGCRCLVAGYGIQMMDL